MTEPVAWGVLSTAKIATGKVIPAIQHSRRGRVEAIASRDLARAERAAAAHGVPRAHGSYEALLADPAIEAIYNPLPNHLHVPWTIRAMEAGKHVLCEKPVAMSAAEAEQLVGAQARTGRLVAEAFMFRHAPQWERVRELAESGRLGDVRAVQTFFSYFLRDPANVRNQAAIGGGGLMDIGCYAIATARYVFGTEPLRIAALVERDPDMGIDRLASALIEFPGGRHLTFTCATQLAPHQHVTIVGTSGRVEVLVPFNAPSDRPCRIVHDDGRDLHGGGAQTEAFAIADQYALQADAFARAVRGETPLGWPIEDAVQNMRVIEAIFRAGETGAWVAV